MAAVRLSNATLPLARDAVLPDFDRSRVTPGILHLGIGNFHRAHQAVYLDRCLAADTSWGIIGASLRRPAAAEALNPQDGLYALVEKDERGAHARIVGSVLGVIDASKDVSPVLERLLAPETRIVSLTVTEKGYCRNVATGDLDESHPDIRADLHRPERPHSIPGLLIEALRLRRQAGRAPFTVLCCDNLPENGRTVARVTRQFAALRDERLARWIEDSVAFPATMVDRIVPATTAQDCKDVAGMIGLEDAAPVVSEVFSQWVVEDRFANGRPDLGAAGVQLVADVTPFETMKLRLLNGAHSTLAYFGQLLGHETVFDAAMDAKLAELIDGLWRETMPTLARPIPELTAYTAALMHRFRNPTLRHATAQIAMDGSQKIPQRLLNTVRDRRAAGSPFDHLAIAVAGWIAYVAGINRRFGVSDPMFVALNEIAEATLPDIRAFTSAVLSLRAIFGDLVDAADFRQLVGAAVAKICERGALSVLQTSAP